MPLEYRYDTALKAVVTRVTGTLEEMDVLTHLRKLRDDSDVPSGFVEIVDFSVAQAFAVKAAGAGRIAFLVPELQERKRYRGTVFFAPNEAALGMARMFRVLLQNLGIESEIYDDWDTLVDGILVRSRKEPA